MSTPMTPELSRCVTSPTLARWIARASATTARIAFPEANDSRVVAAAGLLTRWGVAHPVLLSTGDGSLERALELVRDGAVDGCVAGATLSTGAVLRAARRILGLAQGSDLMSSTTLLELRDGRVVAFADCGVVPKPGEDQLLTIARQAVDTFRRYHDERPRIALLSYSTKASADTPATRTVARVAHTLRGLLDADVDGELQFDAAIDAETARRKGVISPVAGAANVFIFPDLAAANIGYKIAVTLGGARAFGPLLSGLAGNINDVSRGASAFELAATGLLTALAADNPRRVHLMEDVEVPDAP